MHLALYEHLTPLARFAIALLLSLLVPRLAQRCGLPAALGFVFAGVLLGPQLFGVIDQNGPIIRFFADLGKLLLMFFAGFEIDIAQFNRLRNKAALFGALTFTCPFLFGLGTALAFGYGLNSSMVVGSILASHTLLGLTVAKDAGLMSRESVIVTVGATVFTDILSILVLAICLPIHLSGFSPKGLVVLLVELAVYVPLILFGLSWVARQGLRRFGQDKAGRLTVLLVLMAAAAQLAELIHMEGIIGAFLAGIATKRAFEETPTEEALEIVSHSIFIPAFFVSAGFLIDFNVFFHTLVDHPFLVVGIVGGLIAGKFIAAWLAGAVLRYPNADRKLMFAMSVPQVAATLAVALVAYGAKNTAGERLITEPMLNTAIVLVIVSSITGLVLAKKYADEVNKLPA